MPFVSLCPPVFVLGFFCASFSNRVLSMLPFIFVFHFLIALFLYLCFIFSLHFLLYCLTSSCPDVSLPCCHCIPTARTQLPEQDYDDALHLYVPYLKLSIFGCRILCLLVELIGWMQQPYTELFNLSCVSKV